MLTHLQ